MATEKAVNVTWRALREGVERASGETHELVARRAPVLVYNLEGLAYADDGAVLLPQEPDLLGSASNPPPAAVGGNEPALLDEQPGQGLMLLCDLFDGPGAAQGKKCLVAAHAERVTGAPALTLTERRAQNMLAYLQGDVDAWASSCMPCQDIEWQAILQWVAQRFGFPCDPGPIEPILRAAGRRALRSFRESFNAERGGKLELNGDIAVADFAAFFELYDAWLARLLGSEDLSAARAKLAFLDPGAVGCGDAFPNQPARAPDRKPPRPRRVELLFFDGDAPNLELRPPGAHVYQQREFALSRLDVKHGQHVSFDIAFSEDVVAALPADAELELSGPPGPKQQRKLSGGTRSGGSAHYGFDWLDPSVSVTLLARAAGREVTLVDAKSGTALQERRDPDALLEQLLDDEPADDAAEDSLFAGLLPNVDNPVELLPTSPTALVLRLHDAASQPMGGTFFRVRFGATPSAGQAAADGLIELDLPQQQCPEKVELEWGADSAQGPFAFSRGFFVECGAGNDSARLHNLGYDVSAGLDAAVRAFQADYAVDASPAPKGLDGEVVPAATRARLDQLFSDDCDATPKT